MSSVESHTWAYMLWNGINYVWTSILTLPDGNLLSNFIGSDTPLFYPRIPTINDPLVVWSLTCYFSSNVTLIFLKVSTTSCSTQKQTLAKVAAAFPQLKPHASCLLALTLTKVSQSVRYSPRDVTFLTTFSPATQTIPR